MSFHGTSPHPPDLNPLDFLREALPELAALLALGTLAVWAGGKLLLACGQALRETGR